MLFPFHRGGDEGPEGARGWQRQAKPWALPPIHALDSLMGLDAGRKAPEPALQKSPSVLSLRLLQLGEVPALKELESGEGKKHWEMETKNWDMWGLQGLEGTRENSLE